ncbi:MAG: hypothetical protein ACK5U8_32525 [Deltaproteobacteria bacterium]
MTGSISGRRYSWPKSHRVRSSLSREDYGGRVASSTFDNARVEGCIVRQLRNRRFDPSDGGEVGVVFPFLFGASGG